MVITTSKTIDMLIYSTTRPPPRPAGGLVLKKSTPPLSICKRYFGLSTARSGDARYQPELLCSINVHIGGLRGQTGKHLIVLSFIQSAHRRERRESRAGKPPPRIASRQLR